MAEGRYDRRLKPTPESSADAAPFAGILIPNNQANNGPHVQIWLHSRLFSITYVSRRDSIRLTKTSSPNDHRRGEPSPVGDGEITISITESSEVAGRDVVDIEVQLPASVSQKNAGEAGRDLHFIPDELSIPQKHSRISAMNLIGGDRFQRHPAGRYDSSFLYRHSWTD